MATKHTDTCLAKAGDDEPIFTLRAQDELAPLVVAYWAQLAIGSGCNPEKIVEALEVVDAMRAWPTHKLPD